MSEKRIKPLRIINRRIEFRNNNNLDTESDNESMPFLAEGGGKMDTDQKEDEDPRYCCCFS
jgi:amino acid transporter